MWSMGRAWQALRAVQDERALEEPEPPVAVVAGRAAPVAAPVARDDGTYAIA